MKDLLMFVVFAGSFSVLFIPLFISESLFFPFITGKNFAFRVIVEIIFASWAILALLDARYRPRLSWLLISGVALLGVMLVANTLSEYPLRSFWSNYERMDGYVTLVHFVMYFVVLGSVLSNKEIDLFGYKTNTWKLFFWTAFAAAVWVTTVAFRQLAGEVEITQGGWRITGTLGNAAYMAVYMLFNVFIALWLIVQTKTRALQAMLFVFSIIFMFLLVQTATRGTIIGLAGGLGLGAMYIALFSKGYPLVQKIAGGIVLAVVIAVISLFSLKQTDFIQDNAILKRAADVGVEALGLRINIWEMAVEGVKERPILGWGQGNFSYVFNKEYVPEIYNAELWYDRAHNIFLDWMIAGGVLGLLVYLSIFVGLVWYIVIRPLVVGRSNFSVLERGVLLGIVGGYFVHNLVVFDNIVSYIFFAILLGLVHSREAEIIPAIADYKLDEKIVSHVVAPVILVMAGVVIYLVNVPGIQAAGDIIDAFTAPTLETQLVEFESAYNRNSFADQEITEQLVQRTIATLGNPNIPADVKQQFAQAAEKALSELMETKPGDARVHTFVASYYRSLGDIEAAARHVAIARELSPNKPAIIIEQGITAFLAKDFEQMNAFFKEAYELETSNREAQILYASGLMYTEEGNRVDELVEEKWWSRFANNNFAIQAADVNGENELMVRMLETRIAEQPQNAQIRTSLSFVHYRSGDVAKSIQVLEEAIVAIPDFAQVGSCYVNNLKSGDDPSEGCQ